MLVGCPLLESLLINISTREGLHKRVLSVQDFMTKSSVSSGDDEHDHQLEIITVPSLKNLTLNGPWFLDDEIIQVMYGGTLDRPAVFPKLTRLMESRILACYSLNVWLALMRGLPDLKRANCGLNDHSKVGAEILKTDYGLIARTRWVFTPDGCQVFEKAVPLQDTKYYFQGRPWSFPKEDEILEEKE